jgi:hypothetical protein
MRLNRLGALTVCGLLGSTALSSAAYAQLASPAPVRKAIDGNGVDLFKGTFNITAPVLSMGQAEPQRNDDDRQAGRVLRPLHRLRKQLHQYRGQWLDAGL